jgi:uncharacterized protein YxeA
MKKILMMIALLALPFAMQAQTKFHDVELNEAKGAVKKISQSIMGMEQVINFTQDGKMQREGMTNAKYDAEGYLQSATMSVRGQEVNVSFKWENGKVKSQSMDMMGQAVTTTYNYNEQGAIVSQSMNFGGQEMKMEYTNIKYDAKGNWISRTTSMMGQEMELTRTIEYYE